MFRAPLEISIFCRVHSLMKYNYYTIIVDCIPSLMNSMICPVLETQQASWFGLLLLIVRCMAGVQSYNYDLYVIIITAVRYEIFPMSYVMGIYVTI